MFLEHIHTPSVQEDPFVKEAPQPKSATDQSEVEVPAVVDLVMEVLVITPVWTEPYIAYILLLTHLYELLRRRSICLCISCVTRYR